MSERKLRLHIERFDLVIGACIAVIVAAIVGTVVAGDRAGVGVHLIDPATDQPIAPSGTLPGTRPLYLRFGESMNRDTVRLSIVPDVPGVVTWSGEQLIYTPKTAFTGGVTYRITLEGGARAVNGRAVHGSPQWQVRINTPSVVYLYPAIPTSKRLDPPNLYRVVAPGQPEKLTDAPRGVEDFAPSPDGRSIAYTQRDTNNKLDIYLFTLADKSVRRLTNCVQAACRAPDWSPDGRRLVYERADSPQPEADSRAWLLDVNTLATEPLFVEQQWLGKSPRWSRDGRWITMLDSEHRGVVIVEVATGNRSLIPTLENDSGWFAPDSSRLVYPQMQLTDYSVIRTLEIADFAGESRTIHPLRADDALTDDYDAVWHPDGKRLAVMRRYLNDERFTEKFQVYEVDAATGASKPLVVDAAWAHGYLSWSADGDELLMQRYPYGSQDAQPGIWIFDTRSRTLTNIAQNGFMPKWLP